MSDHQNYQEIADSVVRERKTEARVRAMDASEVVDAFHKYEDEIEALEAHVRELEALIRELADDMYHRVTNEYEGTLHYPVMRRRYERDMDVVARALAAVDAKGDGNG